MSQPNPCIESAPHDRHSRFFETDTVKADLKSHAIRSGAYSLSGVIVNLVIGVISTSILARLLLPADFGLLAMVFVIMNLAERFQDIGLGRATIQKQNIGQSEVSNLFWVNAGIGIATCAILALLSHPIAAFYREPRLINVAIALSTTFILGALAIQHQALLARRLKFFQMSLIAIGCSLVNNGVAIFLALRGFGYWSLVWSEVARGIFLVVATFVACPWLPSLPDRKEGVAHHMRFGRDITIFNLVTYVASGLDQMLLGRFAGATATGVYRQAFQLALGPINSLSQGLQSSSEPTFSMLQDDWERYRRAFQKTVSVISMVTMPLAAGAFICARPFVLLFLGDHWYPAITLVRILAVAAFIRPAVSTIGPVMISSGRSKKYATLGVLDSIALAAALCVGVLWGAKGIASAQVAASYLVFLPVVWWALKDTPVALSVWLNAVARPVFCSVIMVVILYFSFGLIHIADNAAALAFFVPEGALCYIAAMLVIPGGRRLLVDFLNDVLSAIRRKREQQAATAA
jgi:O-antigen/teichoic acid export membrane protein